MRNLQTHIEMEKSKSKGILSENSEVLDELQQKLYGKARQGLLIVFQAMDAAGKDVVIVETVGTGQSEVEIMEVAQTVIVVCAPGLVISGIVFGVTIWAVTGSSCSR